MRNARPYGLIAAVAGALYLPFLGNPPVFDDRGLYSGYQFSEHASSPFGLGLRYPALETVGRVRLSVPRAAVPFVIDPVLPTFHERHPRVDPLELARRLQIQRQAENEWIGADTAAVA